MHLAPIHIILAVLLTALLTTIVVAVIVRRRDMRKVAFMLDALEDGELNFRFRETSNFNKTLNRIRTLFHKQRQVGEQDSWQKLVRVLTHEIMNTVSPIASLSDALAQSLDEHVSKDSEYESLRKGLETIADSSRNLISFVQSYRQLTGVAKPQRRTLDLTELVNKVLSLTGEHSVIFQSTPNHISIFADEGQITQVFINLVLNARQAGAKTITITARQDRQDQVTIDIENDGQPIPVAAQEQIFVPFYTTKQHGSGIGLSLSRQIILMHGGSLTLLHSTPSSTTFRLLLL